MGRGHRSQQHIQGSGSETAGLGSLQGVLSRATVRAEAGANDAGLSPESGRQRGNPPALSGL